MDVTCAAADPKPSFDAALQSVALDESEKRLELWREGSLCDVLVVCGGVTVAKAFKADLACWSDYFRKLFSNDFKDSKGTEVCVEDVDPAVLGLVIRAMYERKIGLSHGNVSAVLDLADRLQMPCLLDAVKEFLISKLRIDNAIDCLLLAETHSMDSLWIAALCVVVEDFECIPRLDLARLPFAALLAALGSDKLSLPDESLVLLVVEHWSEANLSDSEHEEAETQLLRLLANVRFSLINERKMHDFFSRLWPLKYPRVLAAMARGALCVAREGGELANRTGASIRIDCWHLRVMEAKIHFSTFPVSQGQQRKLASVLRKPFHMPTLNDSTSKWELILRWEGSGSWLTHMSISVICTSRGEALPGCTLQMVLVCRDGHARHSPCTICQNPVRSVNEREQEELTWQFWHQSTRLPLPDPSSSLTSRDELQIRVRPLEDTSRPVAS